MDHNQSGYSSDSAMASSRSSHSHAELQRRLDELRRVSPTRSTLKAPSRFQDRGRANPLPTANILAGRGRGRHERFQDHGFERPLPTSTMTTTRPRPQRLTSPPPANVYTPRTRSPATPLPDIDWSLYRPSPPNTQVTVDVTPTPGPSGTSAPGRGRGRGRGGNPQPGSGTPATSRPSPSQTQPLPQQRTRSPPDRYGHPVSSSALRFETDSSSDTTSRDDKLDDPDYVALLFYS